MQQHHGTLNAGYGAGLHLVTETPLSFSWWKPLMYAWMHSVECYLKAFRINAATWPP